MQARVDIQTAELYIGRSVYKHFPQYGYYWGTVIEVNDALEDDYGRTGPFFRILYVLMYT